jgi:hypothetical protein
MHADTMFSRPVSARRNRPTAAFEPGKGVTQPSPPPTPPLLSAGRAIFNEGVCGNAASFIQVPFILETPY